MRENEATFPICGSFFKEGSECSTIFKSFEFSQSDSVVTALKHICDKSFVRLTITTKKMNVIVVASFGFLEHKMLAIHGGGNLASRAGLGSCSHITCPALHYTRATSSHICHPLPPSFLSTSLPSPLSSPSLLPISLSESLPPRFSCIMCRLANLTNS